MNPKPKHNEQTTTTQPTSRNCSYYCIFSNRYLSKHLVMTIKTYPMIALGYYKTKTESKFNYLTLRRTEHHHILILCFLITIDKNI